MFEFFGGKAFKKHGEEKEFHVNITEQVTTHD